MKGKGAVEFGARVNTEEGIEFYTPYIAISGLEVLGDQVLVFSANMKINDEEAAGLFARFVYSVLTSESAKGAEIHDEPTESELLF